MSYFKKMISPLSVGGKKLKERSARKDISDLVKLELKTLLLDVEGLVLPAVKPKPPKLPQNFDFHFA